MAFLGNDSTPLERARRLGWVSTARGWEAADDLNRSPMGWGMAPGSQ